jgi:hypothetical protein
LQHNPSDRPRTSLFGSAKATTPEERNASAVARVAFVIPAAFILLGLVLERGWLYLPYFVTEWMINYSGGFVRRGFVGESFWVIGHSLHIPPMPLIEVGRFVLATTFSVVAGSLVYKNRAILGWLGALAVLASPYFVFFLWCDAGSLDVLFILLTVAHANLVRTGTTRYFLYAFALFATFGTALALTHEGLLLVSLPINLALFRCATPKLSWRKGLAIFGLPIVASGVAIAFHGTPAQAQTIYQHWRVLGFNQPYEIGFEQIGLSLQEELHRIWKDFSWVNLPIWALNVVLCSGPLLIIGARIWNRNSADRRILVWLFVVPFLLSLPIYVVGADWDRWVTITVVTGVLSMLCLSPSAQPFKPSRRNVAAICALLVIGLFLRPYSPFVPIHRFIAGPLTRAELYFRGQTPT